MEYEIDNFGRQMMRVFDMAYSPLVQELASRAPLLEEETSEKYAMRMAALARTSQEIANLMDRIMVAGDRFIRFALLSYQSCYNESDYTHFRLSGYGHLTSVFVLLFPYEVLKYTRGRGAGRPFPGTFKALFDIASDTATTTVAWYRIILPQSMTSMDYFPEATLRAIHDY
jgi:hypothetical protein